MDISDIEYKEYKRQYNKERYERNKDKMKEASKTWYIKKVSEDLEYREVLKNKTNERRHRNQDEEPKPRGRPRTTEPKEKKANGRPRKY